MKRMRKMWLGLLLLAGSANVQAQDSAPFPEVNNRLYQGSMTITAQVVQNAEVVTDAVVAVYCGDEIRGRNSVGSGTNPGLVYLTVYGHTSGTQQNLYFKVYTGGMTFTCNPDPAILFKNNDSRGMEADPCIITLPVSLANNADNSRVLTAFSQQPCDVVLTDRTLYKDGAWNTLCLPFNLRVDGSVLDGDGVEVRTLSDTDFSDGTLTLNFTPATGEGAVTELVAGTPYIIKWDNSGSVLENPVFTDVTISSVAAVPVTTTYVDFVGTFSPEGIYTAENTNLYLGDGETGISTTNYTNYTNSDGVWYDLSGRKLEGVLTAKGVYIVGGRKVVVK